MQQTTTTARSLASLPESKRKRLLASLSAKEKAIAYYDWSHWARPNQLAPEGQWTIWTLLAGRGYGKTRAGAEWFRHRAETTPRGRGMILAMTPADARDVMILGPSGIMSVCPPWNKPTYEPSKSVLTWPNGFTAVIRSAHNPEKVRGPEQEVAWADELAAWPDKKGRAAWSNLMLGLRIGDKPQALVTTTPKPTPLVKEILARSVKTGGSTYENLDNLAPAYFDEIVARLEGSTLGRQEIYAELLEEAEGALWKHSLIEKNRVDEYPNLVRAVVGVDPSGGVVETGIVSAGIDGAGHVYILSDSSLRTTPGLWGARVLSDYDKYKLDVIVGEKNFGGDMVEHTIGVAAKERSTSVQYKHVIASRGKILRAEPVVALYEKGRVHHVGSFAALEAEMTMWVPGEPSPNRLDALVWAVTELAVTDIKPVREKPYLLG